MSFITRHRKPIALIAVFSFLYLVGIGSLPLPAANGTDNDQQPGAIEKVGPTRSGAAVAKKSPVLPIIIGVAVVGAVAAVLILVVFKTKYDIVGTWTGQFTNDSNDVWTVTIIFTGDKKSGTLVYNDEWGDGTGTYTVDGKDVSFNIGVEEITNFTGSFSDKDRMSGTWFTPFDGGANGTWTLNRGAASAATAPNAELVSLSSPFKKR